MTVSETVLETWKYDNMEVNKHPNRPDGALHVDVTSSPTDVVSCVSFRGDRSRCVLLLERAIKALKHPE